MNILVTGATDGIGHATASALLAHGARVLVHGRDRAKATRAAAALSDDADRAVPVWGDFTSMKSVVGLASQVHAHADSLDVLINNAGVYAKQRRIVGDGFELTMAVNHFAHWLLTERLLPLLLAARAGRIVIVSSMTHSGAHLALDDLDIVRDWDPYGAYASSKLANLLTMRRLARELSATPVTVNALHPGVVGTKLLRAGFAMAGATPAAGARTSLYLAESADVAGVSGEYFVDCRRTRPSRTARDDRLADGLWRASGARLAPYLSGSLPTV